MPGLTIVGHLSWVGLVAQTLVRGVRRHSPSGSHSPLLSTPQPHPCPVCIHLFTGAFLVCVEEERDIFRILQVMLERYMEWGWGNPRTVEGAKGHL